MIVASCLRGLLHVVRHLTVADVNHPAGMRSDVGWQTSAADYAALYRRLRPAREIP